MPQCKEKGLTLKVFSKHHKLPVCNGVAIYIMILDNRFYLKGVNLLCYFNPHLTP